MQTTNKEIKTQKLSFQASQVLLKMFNERISKLPISRDLFLQNLIKTESEFLADDLNGKRLSDDARTVVARRLRYINKGTKQVSVVIDADVAARLNEVVEKHNIVRDSFLNRIIYFLLLTEPFRKRMKLPDMICTNEISDGGNGLCWESIPISPIDWIANVLSDPLCYLRKEISRIRTQEYEEDAAKLYLIPMPEKLLGLTCYEEDIFLPGTSISKKIDKELAKAMKDF